MIKEIWSWLPPGWMDGKVANANKTAASAASDTAFTDERHYTNYIILDHGAWHDRTLLANTDRRNFIQNDFQRYVLVSQ